MVDEVVTTNPRVSDSRQQQVINIMINPVPQRQVQEIRINFTIAGSHEKTARFEDFEKIASIKHYISSALY